MDSVVFFGSGPVAAKSLELLAKDFRVEAVITKAAKHHSDKAPTLNAADELGIISYTPANRPELDQLITTRTFSSRLGIIIDYGIIVSQAVIDSFDLGIVNSHFSLLPQWRGADPITFAILSGQRETGVSLMLINDKMDEGPLLAQASLVIADKDSGPSLTDKLIVLSNNLLESALPKYISGQLKPRPQANQETASYSRKLTKQDGILDWRKPAIQLEREIRAYAEWPKSRADIYDIDTIVTAAHVIDSNQGAVIGQLTIIGQKLIIQTGKSALQIDHLKPAGRAEMSASEFIRGYSTKLHEK